MGALSFCLLGLETQEGVSLGGGKVMLCLCLALQFPQMPFTFPFSERFCETAMMWLTAFVAWSQVKPSSGGKLEIPFKEVLSNAT